MMTNKYEKLFSLGKIDCLYEGCDYATNGGGIFVSVLASLNSNWETYK
jgi:hypothetical protein